MPVLFALGVRCVAAHWRAALVALFMFALGWHVGAARVTAQWSTEKAATAEKQTKALATALANQHAAEQKVAAIDQQFNDEVSKHANDVLAYRAQLAAGTDRLSVHVARCVPAAAEGASAAGGADGAAARADLAPAAADGVAAVAGDDQREIDKLDALQAYIRAMQAQGFIARAESGGK